MTTIVLVGVTRAALRERQYSAVMAATGLLYLAILTAFGTDLIARAVLACSEPVSRASVVVVDRRARTSVGRSPRRVGSDAAHLDLAHADLEVEDERAAARHARFPLVGR